MVFKHKIQVMILVANQNYNQIHKELFFTNTTKKDIPLYFCQKSNQQRGITNELNF